MTASDYILGGLRAIRYAVAFTIMLLIWLVLGMTALDTFFPPFEELRFVLTPWKGLDQIPAELNMSARLSYIESLLKQTELVANASLILMLSAFVVFSVYLTFLYQQRQRRMQENRLLLLKNQEVLRRNEFIRYISATIGHEFKNNLGRIKRRLDLLGSLPPEAAHRVDENFHRLFTDIDIFKQIADGRESVLANFTEINLCSLLRTISQEHADLADVSFESSCRSLEFYASEPLLRSVFENLFDNSIKNRRADQERASIHIQVEIEYDGPRRYVRIVLRDQGRGMTDEEADKCFYMSGEAEGASGEGWGKGLTFVKYAVGLHAGKVRIGREHTAPGEGTEVIVNLPYVEEKLDV